ncbi:MAG: hypothetical protein JWM76_5217, partial [Pseudonocardiales bacterium]|nr:hypothetical protein [Pseudonocardiales bacterium]
GPVCVPHRFPVLSRELALGRALLDGFGVDGLDGTGLSEAATANPAPEERPC